MLIARPRTESPPAKPPNEPQCKKVSPVARLSFYRVSDLIPARDCFIEHPAPSSIPPSRVMPARVAKQLNELGKVRVQTEGFRDATEVVMAPSVVICTRLAMQ